MIEIRNLKKMYRKKVAIQEFSLSIENKVYGLLGPNGSGKTTLLRIIARLLRPTSGTVQVPENYRIGYLPQRFGVLKELTVYEHMEMFSNFKRIPIEDQKPIIQQALEIVNLSEHLKDRCGSLSGGMIRRIGIAQAILGNPDIILFDEPTAGLDPEERLRFKNILHEITGICPILLSTHILEDVEAVCEKIIILNQGKIEQIGSGAQISAVAEGMVYEMEEDAINGYLGKHYIERYMDHHDGKRYVRILFFHPDEKIPGRKVPPTVEDGYMYLLKRQG